jgi:protein O-mannosyl-transferase
MVFSSRINASDSHLDRATVLATIFLVAITIVSLFPVLSCQFTNIDDNIYVTANDHVRQGLNWHNARWALTAMEAANWHPVTWLSHMLDVTLFGLNARGHHATSLFIHLLNAILLFFWLRTATRQVWPSAFVAALFAVHPLALESVAFIAERKNVLSTLFLILTLWAYLSYTRKPHVWRYLLVVTAFMLGLMSKPMLVTVPFALLLLDYWPLGRLGPQNSVQAPTTPAHPSVTWQTLLHRCLEKLPLLLLALLSSLLTLKAQAIDSEIKTVPLLSRLANAVLSYGIYLKQMIWPSGLAVFYPYRDWSIFAWPVVLSLLLVCTITALVVWPSKVWQIKARPYLAVGWFWYLGTLIPVVGLVHVGDIAHADRYTYVPLLGIFIALAWGAAELASRARPLRYGLIAGGSVAVLALAITSFTDTSYWHDGISLTEHAIAVTGPNTLMERALGETLYTQGRVDEGLDHLMRSLRLQPTDVAFYDVGTIKLQQNNPPEAAFYFQKALDYPSEAATQAQVHNNLAVLEMQQGSLADAEKHFQKSLALVPDSARHRIAYGWLLVRESRYDEAVAQFEQAIKISPDAMAYFSLGSAFEQQHKLDQAADAYRKTLALSPNLHEAQARLDAITGAGR